MFERAKYFYHIYTLQLLVRPETIDKFVSMNLG
jgi:hypothetical protein